MGWTGWGRLSSGCVWCSALVHGRRERSCGLHWRTGLHSGSGVRNAAPSPHPTPAGANWEAVAAYVDVSQALKKFDPPAEPKGTAAAADAVGSKLGRAASAAAEGAL